MLNRGMRIVGDWGGNTGLDGVAVKVLPSTGLSLCDGVNFRPPRFFVYSAGPVVSLRAERKEFDICVFRARSVRDLLSYERLLLFPLARPFACWMMSG